MTRRARTSAPGAAAASTDPATPLGVGRVRVQRVQDRDLTDGVGVR